MSRHRLDDDEALDEETGRGIPSVLSDHPCQCLGSKSGSTLSLPGLGDRLVDSLGMDWGNPGLGIRRMENFTEYCNRVGVDMPRGQQHRGGLAWNPAEIWVMGGCWVAIAYMYLRILNIL